MNTPDYPDAENGIQESASMLSNLIFCFLNLKDPGRRLLIDLAINEYEAALLRGYNTDGAAEYARQRVAEAIDRIPVSSTF